MQGRSSNGETLEPFIAIISEILYTKQIKIDQNKKMYLAKLLPNHAVLKDINKEQLTGLDPKSVKEVLITSITSY